MTKDKAKICRGTTSSQQFILKEYLAFSPPDLFVLFGNAHDSFRYTLREYTMNVRTLADMIDIYLSPKTKLVWTSKPAEYAERKTAKFRGQIYDKCLANAKRPCDCRVLCLRLKSSLCSCAHSISDMTSFGCRDQCRDSVCPVLWISTWRNSKRAGKRRA